MRSRLGLATCGTVLFLTCPLCFADEDEDELDRTPVDCVSTTRIRQTEIIDDRTILFYLRGGRVYNNILDRDCPDLKREDRFAYEVRGGRLCSVDMIRVLPRIGGIGFGATCRLGDFHPITREEAELLELEPDALAERQGSVVIRPIELPPDESTEGAGSADPAAGAEAEGVTEADTGTAVDAAPPDSADAPAGERR